ncbi:hypothetical protein RIF23_14505 [Lipingzhangella sp. LS1_29]|uniref:Secreted protein n=1 Tax=Lipingzhangella rawalii TaxID=2055835 RepID=A0ABU2H873_9ACTN|nr:hypothetical protein [Lipingzhangella rawalii]MDS1271507.1 hypothetical protein [Lipingzhangella rawalii]
MEPLAYVVLGGAISLVSSATVTWLQGRHSRKTADRDAARAANRELTRLFIAERDAARSTDSGTGSGRATNGIRSEAELLTSAITDKRVRERLRHVVRLLQELHLPELQELSGTQAGTVRELLCGHALDVLGAHFRGERIPAQPEEIQRLLKVEDEALRIHHGGTPRSGEDTGDTTAESPKRPSTGRTSRNNRRGTKAGDEDSTASTKEEQGSTS